MKRLTRVMAQSRSSVTLKLEPSERCAGCPKNCNEPLFKLFGRQNQRLILNRHDPSYELISAEPLFEQHTLTGQTIELNFEHRQFLLTSAWFYLLPLVLITGLILAGHVVAGYTGLNHDLGAFIGLLIALLLINRMMNWNIHQKTLKIRPKVTILYPRGTSP